MKRANVQLFSRTCIQHPIKSTFSFNSVLMASTQSDRWHVLCIKQLELFRAPSLLVLSRFAFQHNSNLLKDKLWRRRCPLLKELLSHHRPTGLDPLISHKCENTKSFCFTTSCQLIVILWQKHFFLSVFNFCTENCIVCFNQSWWFEPFFFVLKN